MGKGRCGGIGEGGRRVGGGGGSARAFHETYVQLRAASSRLRQGLDACAEMGVQGHQEGQERTKTKPSNVLGLAKRVRVGEGAGAVCEGHISISSWKTTHRHEGRTEDPKICWQLNKVELTEQSGEIYSRELFL